MADGGGFFSGTITHEQADKTEQLITALRDLPSDFKWDFAYMDTCACGLARRIGLVKDEEDMIRYSPLGMLTGDAARVFCSGVYYNPILAFFFQPGPEQIAKRLESWLNRQTVVATSSEALPLPSRAESAGAQHTAQIYAPDFSRRSASPQPGLPGAGEATSASRNRASWDEPWLFSSQPVVWLHPDARLDNCQAEFPESAA